MKKQLLAMACVFYGGVAGAADLLQIYRDAEQHDAQFAAARAQLDAGRERLPQGRAGLLPVLGLSASSTWNDNSVRLVSAGVDVSPAFNAHGWTLSLNQPLLRWQNWIQYDQARIQVAQSELQFAQARQDLLLRVAQAYFDVLYAQENLRAIEVTAEAIAQQLEQARKNFEVGTATITDTHEAQARQDQVTAQVIAARSDLEVKQHALRTLTGKDPVALAPLRPEIALPGPRPESIEAWLAAAEKDAFPVQLQEAAAELAARERERQRAGHYPTVDLVASRGYNKTLASATIGVTQTEFASVGVQLNIPLYQGGAVTSKEREAAASLEAARAGLEGAKRNAVQAARQSYLGVVSGLAQVRALEAARVSTQSALESTRLGYEVGVRINIDVLNAEQQVYAVRRDLARARFDTLLAQLRLKAAVGGLAVDDLQAVNGLLAH